MLRKAGVTGWPPQARPTFWNYQPTRPGINTAVFREIREAVGHRLEYVTAAAVEGQIAVTRDMSASMQMSAAAMEAVIQKLMVISTSNGKVTHAVGTTKQADRVRARRKPLRASTALQAKSCGIGLYPLDYRELL